MGGSAGKRPAPRAGSTAAGNAAGSAAGSAKVGKTKRGSDHAQNKLTVAQRWKIVRAVQGGQQKSKVAREYGVSKSYVTKLMKPDKITALEKARDVELNMDAKRTLTPVHADLEVRLNQWIKIARQ